MDEIASVRAFRASVAQRDDEARRRAFDALARRMEERQSALRRSRRVWILAAAVLFAVVVATSASGWTTRLLHMIAGEPAPTPVRRAFAIHEDARPREFPIFRDSPAMQVVEEKAHGVMGIDTSMGDVLVWSAPTRGGGRCLLVDIVRLRKPSGEPNAGWRSCGPSPLPAEVPPVFGVSATRIGDSYLHLVSGEVSIGVAAVELRYPDERGEILPVFERFFIAELRDGKRPNLMITRDANGAEIKRRRAAPPMAVGPGSIPEPIGPERELIRLDTSTGHVLTFSLAPGPNGQVCKATRYRGSIGKGCGPDLRERVQPDEILITSFLFNEPPDGKPLVGLEGVVGEDVARLEIRYTDGTVEPVPVTERFVFFEIRTEHHRDEAFTLVGRGKNGAELDRRVID